MAPFVFRKSTHSDPRRECVEVATNVPRTVAVRDSKRPGGPTLHIAPRAWSAFLGSATHDGGVTEDA